MTTTPQLAQETWFIHSIGSGCFYLPVLMSALLLLPWKVYLGASPSHPAAGLREIVMV
jgi:hypothetical protein